MAGQIDIVTRFKIWYAAPPRALRLLLTINVVAYLLWQVVLAHIGVVNEFVSGYLALRSAWPDVLRTLWQLLTYNFLHLDFGLDGLIHIAFNMLWLVWIGREYENTHGPEKLMAVYLLAGVGGGVLTVLYDLVSPATFVVYGASASVLGVVAAVAFLYPHRSIALLFIGNVRLLYLLYFVLALDVFIALFGAGRTAVAAHFGGAMTGALFALAQKNGVDIWSWAAFMFPGSRVRRRPASRRPAPGDSSLGRLEYWLASRNKKETARITRLEPSHREDTRERGTESELDRILDKISEEGFEALTPDERRFLEKASQD